MALVRAAWSRASFATIASRGSVARSKKAHFRPVLKLSKTVTLDEVVSRRWFTRWAPMKPAPPVTKYLGAR